MFTSRAMLYKLLVILVLVLAGCQSSFGPEAVRNTHPSYNQAVVDSLNGEMLLNLVRLKYRDEILFLKINSITTALTLNATIGNNISLSSGTSSLAPSTGLSYTQLPTLSYAPMAGDLFFKSIMAPIPLDSLFAFIRNGWNIERLLNMCVERVNELYNIPSREFDNKPEKEKFRRLASLLRKLQTSHSIEIGKEKNELMILFKYKQDNASDIDQVYSLLNLKGNDKGLRKLIITDNSLAEGPDKIIVEPRGISSIMHYLAQYVRIPREHVEAGLVDNSKEYFSEGGGNEYSSATDSLFDVQVSSWCPDNAFIAVPYRDNCYYISDSDLMSKSVFQLLSNLFSLQAGQSSNTSTPVLTIPAR
jgi:hypothetical protein